MVNVTMTREELHAMLEREAARYGYTVNEVRDMATAGELEEPELRDLWLIWGDGPLANKRQA